jgi:Tol biopolymer transport system component
MQNGITTRVSVASDGGEGNYWSGSFSVHTDNGWDPYSWPIPISADGRFVVFESGASNLASGDTNSASDVFVHDRETGETSRVSLASNGEQGNSGSGFPSLSADGRFVAFQSAASNLVSGDTNECDPKYGPFNCLDVFVHDRVTGETTRVSVASDGSQGNGGDSISPAISADGRYVAFMSDAGGLVENDNNNYCDYYYPVTDWNCVDIFIYDRQTGKTKLVSMASNGLQGNEHSFYPAISADGRLVAFTSAADNLVNSDTNSAWDVFVHDNQTGVTSRSSVDSTGSQANGRSWDSFSFNRYTGSWTPSLSMSGRFVAFTSWASNLVSGDNNEYCNWSSSPNCPDVFVRDRGGLDGHFP